MCARLHWIRLLSVHVVLVVCVGYASQIHVSAEEFRAIRQGTLREAQDELRVLPPDDEARTNVHLRLGQLIAAEMDQWGARAVEVLLREEAGLAPEHFYAAAEFWLGDASGAGDLPAMVDLIEAMNHYRLRHTLYFDGKRPEHAIEKLWAVVAESGPRTLQTRAALALLELGSVLGSGPRGRIAADAVELDLGDEVAGWAHATLAMTLYRRSTYREAIVHARAALELEPRPETTVHQRAVSVLRSMNSPRVQATGAELYRPGSRHRFDVKHRNLNGWEIQIRRLDPLANLLPNSSRSSSLSGMYPVETGPVVRTLEIPNAKEAEARESDWSPLGAEYTTPVILDPLPPGLYMARIQARTLDPGFDLRASYLAFMVTGIGFIEQPTSTGGVTAWLVDLDDGSPVRDAFLTALTSARHGIALPGCQTDALGIVQVETPSREHVLLVGEPQGHPVVQLLRSTASTVSPKGTRRAGFVLTDRPVYRPGDQVRIQCFVRESEPQQRSHLVPSGESVRIRIYDARNTAIADRVVELDANGSAETSMELAEGARLGAYRVELSYPDGTRRFHRSNFQVEEYRRPEFVVDVVIDEGSTLRWGDTLRARIEARHLFGNPVAGTVEITVWQAREAGASPSTKVLTKRTRLDRKGRFVLEYETDPTKSQSAVMTVVARVTDGSRREEEGTVSIGIDGTGARAWLKPRAAAVRVQESIEIDLKITSALDRERPYSGFLEIEHRGEGGPQVLVRRALETDTAGHSVIRFAPPYTGEHRVRFTGRDGAGRIVTAEATFWSAGNSVAQLPPSWGVLHIESVESEAPMHQPIQLLVASNVPDAHVLLNVFLEGEIQRHLVTVRGTSAIVELPASTRYAPSFHVQAQRVHGFQLETSETEVKIATDHGLDVEVAFDKPSYRPGEQATLQVTARDRRGGPVSAPVTLAVIDDAILALKSRDLGAVNNLFRFDNPRPRPARVVWPVSRSFVELDSTDQYRSVQGVQGRLATGKFALRHPAPAPRSHRPVPTVNPGPSPPVRQVVGNRSDVDGQIEGTVFNHETGMAIDYANVVLTRPSDEMVWGAMTLDGGRFSFKGVPPGDYAMRFLCLGYKEVTHRLEVRRSAIELSVPMTVTIVREFDVFSVEGSSIMVEVKDAEFSQAIGSEDLTDYAVDSVAEAVSRQAGVVSRNGELFVRGGRSGEVKFRIDGVVAKLLPTLRKDFRESALWRTAVWTDAAGHATVEFALPQSLTRWNALAFAMTADTRIGYDVAYARSHQPLMVQLAHPRVFREKDRCRVSALVHNDTAVPQQVEVQLSADSIDIESAMTQTIDVPSWGVGRVEWKARVPQQMRTATRLDDETGNLNLIPLEVPLQVTARSAQHADAVEESIKLLPHGLPVSYSTAAEVAAGVTNLELELPHESLTPRHAVLRLSPNALGACDQALGYLAQYPYGCVEQTLSRFVPAVAVRDAVSKLSFSELKPDPDLDAKIQTGIDRIASLQKEDGSWGWFGGHGRDTFISAYALVALARAAMGGASVNESMIRRGRDALHQQMGQADRLSNPNLAYTLYALAHADGILRPEHGLDESPRMRREVDRLMSSQEQLGDYATALLATYLVKAQRSDDARQLAVQLRLSGHRDAINGQLYWGQEDGYRSRHSGAMEATSYAVEALVSIEPSNPDALAAVRWILSSRDGDRWQNTRTTAHAIYALTTFATVSGDMGGDYELLASIDGREVGRHVVSSKSGGSRGAVLPIPVDFFRQGSNRLRVELRGTGRCYAALTVQGTSSLERPQPTGDLLRVDRHVARVQPTDDGQWAVRRGRGSSASGDRLRVELRIRVDTDLQYIAIEDPRAAGAEPLGMESGPVQVAGLSGHQEVRDDRTVFFFSRLPQGEHVIQYDLRAETPGEYHVMPTVAYAMYVPGVRATSEEDHLDIVPSR